MPFCLQPGEDPFEALAQKKKKNIAQNKKSQLDNAKLFDKVRAGSLPCVYREPHLTTVLVSLKAVLVLDGTKLRTRAAFMAVDIACNEQSHI